MIKTLYSKYFQKSRSFLYPMLSISRKDNPGPVQTYMSWQDISPEDKKLVCLYAYEDTPEFNKFQNEKLITHPLYESHTQVGDHVVFIFDYTIYYKDWDLFMDGKYSQLSLGLKEAIRKYYGADSSEYQFVETYLFPEKYFELYSKLLDIDLSTLRSVGELCDQFDRDKEILIFSAKRLEISE